jgi:methylated-DNA-[protein]-cysteine S-methyltransferase
MPSASFPTPLGRCTIGWNDAGLTHFHLPGPAATGEATPATDPPPWVRAVIDRVLRHLAGDLQNFADLRYDFSSQPAFLRAVLQATLAVKAGHTATYGDIARAIGEGPAASRAVGAALGANPWPLLIPCHRVVAADGGLTGYSGPGGTATKAKLLALEGARLL